MQADDPLWQQFAAESEEHLDAIERLLGAGAAAPGAVDALFRAFHSLKGMGGALGAAGLTMLAHRCEDVLGAARAGRLAIAGEAAAALVTAADALRGLRAALLEGQDQAAPAALLARVEALAGGTAPAPAAPPQTTQAAWTGPLEAGQARARGLARLAATLEEPPSWRQRGRLRRLALLLGADAAALAEEARAAGGEAALRPALAALAARLEALLVAEDSTAGRRAAEAAAEAADIAGALGLEAPERALRRIEDLADRGSEPEAAFLLATEGPAMVERLRQAATGAFAVLSGPVQAAAAPEALPLPIPPGFAVALGQEGRRRAAEALAEGRTLYRARLALGLDAAAEAGLAAWLTQHAPPLATLSRLDATPPHLDALLASPLAPEALAAERAAFDPGQALLLALSPVEAAAPAPTMRVRQESVDSVIALQAEVRAAALALGEAIEDGTLAAVASTVPGHIAERLRRLRATLEGEQGRLQRGLRALDAAVLELRLMPIGTLFARLPRAARAVAEAAGKQVALRLEGEAVEVDRSLVEQLADPLLHLVRNAVDHGVERPAERRAAGKPEQATLRLSATRRPGSVAIEVADDGRGIDRAAVLARAVERGLVAPEAALSDAAVHALLFHPGFSTAATVTEVSGRGVGLDVVQEAVRRAGGTVEIETTPGRGTCFRLRLPVNAALLPVLLVEAGGTPYALPAARVQGVLAAGAPLPEGVPERSLAALLGLEEDAPGPAVLVGEGAPHLALRVGQVRRQAELLLRPLHPMLARLPAVAGLGVLGTGEPVVVLEPEGL